ncbi:hypothetical protein RIF29_18528 [Crotalaria pallida]|uniref:Choline kinase n=1 Tax=Crotalaria pallida TaxID=3830 RepID=A0AAN9FJ07_CROPI
MIDEENSSITFIDYEFASHNHIAYDLAYHFCEMEADYHSDNPHVIHYSKYPGLEERQRFIYIYLSSDGKKPSNIEVEQLVNVAEKYTLACHLFYGLWGLLWNAIRTADFDCKEYARQRLEQYWSKKITLLDSSSIISQNGICQ